MATKGVTNPPRIPWHLINAWVEQKQAYESRHDQPAPVTAEEEKVLIPLLKLLTPTRPASPELANGNWIGWLQEKMQRDGWPIPSYEEELVPVLPGTPPLFRCYVRARGLPDALPGPDYGLGPDGECPSFANKKKAKTYAAQCAFEFLERKAAAARSGTGLEGLRAPASAHHRDPEPAPPPPKKVRTTAEQRMPAETVSPKLPKQPEVMLSSTADRRGGENSHSSKLRDSFANDTPESFVARVSKLCQETGKESPEYKLVQMSDGYFEGYPVFKFPPIDMPPDLGFVRDSLGKKETKERIAEAVFTFLYKEKQEHLERVREFMKDMAPPDN